MISFLYGVGLVLIFGSTIGSCVLGGPTFEPTMSNAIVVVIGAVCFLVALIGDS